MPELSSDHSLSLIYCLYCPLLHTHFKHLHHIGQSLHNYPSYLFSHSLSEVRDHHPRWPATNERTDCGSDFAPTLLASFDLAAFCPKVRIMCLLGLGACSSLLPSASAFLWKLENPSQETMFPFCSLISTQGASWDGTQAGCFQLQRGQTWLFITFDVWA